MKIELDGGKYTYIFSKGDQHALRYGEPWRDLVGDTFVYCMACRITELEESLLACIQQMENEDPLINSLDNIVIDGAREVLLK